jgi:hypothetical protein
MTLFSSILTSLTAVAVSAVWLLAAAVPALVSFYLFKKFGKALGIVAIVASILIIGFGAGALHGLYTLASCTNGPNVDCFEIVLPPIYFVMQNAWLIALAVVFLLIVFSNSRPPTHTTRTSSNGGA